MVDVEVGIEPLLKRFRDGDRRALSRLISLLASGQHVETIRAALKSNTKESNSHVVALTGSGGVGKSTLIGKLIELLRERGQSVAVLACDPESSLTGGALLGDRIRMPSRPDDGGVFIRSLAVASGHQAIADNLDLMIGLFGQFGFSVVVLETVGSGQGDTAVRDVADVVALLVQPEAGDELQWEKAGVLEIADLVVINKSDLPGSDRVEAQLRDMLNLPGCREVPVVRTCGSRNEGLDKLWQSVERLLADSN